MLCPLQTRRIIDTANEILEKKAMYGEEAARELLNACEENMKVLIKADAHQRAQRKALETLHTRITNSASPEDVQKAFGSATTEATAEEEQSGSCDHLRELRSIIARALRADDNGAGPSGEHPDDMDLGEDGFAMTQTTRSTKCSLLVREFEPTGEFRPMKGKKCGHTFSYKGLQSLFASKKGPQKCPMMGCNASYSSLADFEEDKALATQLKRAARDLD